MHTLVSAFCNAVLIGIFLVAFGAAFGRIHPYIDIMGQFLFAAMVAAGLVALLALLTARHVTALVAIAALLANLLIAWPWLQATAPVDAKGPHFKVLLFNVYYNNRHLDQVARLARETDADIVVLLEIIPRVRPGLDNVVADYPHRVECWPELDCDALILSRYPLADIRATLPAPKHRRPTAVVETTIDGRKLTLFAAHLSIPPPLHRRHSQMDEMQAIAEAVNGLSGPRLLVGDFNAVTWGAIVSHARAYASLHVLTGPSGTWPAFLPRDIGMPIDHMLASHDVVFKSRKLITMPGSDHRAVLAEVAFKN